METLTYYVEPEKLAELWPDRSNGWVLGRRKKDQRIKTVQVGKVIYKERFADEKTMSELLEKLRELKIKDRPSSFGSIYHAVAGPEYPIRSYLACSPRSPYGPWEERLRIADEDELVHQFDLNAAYAWAGLSRPLPDHRYSRPVRGSDAAPSSTKTGLWLGTWRHSTRLILPPHLRGSADKKTWVCSEELEEYDLTPKDVRFGIVFERRTDKVRRNLERIITKFGLKLAKPILRSYWGAFGSREGSVVVPKKAPPRALPNIYREPAFAHFIESRIRTRMFEVVQRNAYMVYVDAVITREKLKTGHAFGAWRHVEIGKAAKRFGVVKRAAQ